MVDSLKEVLATIEQDSSKVHLYKDIGYHLSNVDLEEASMYVDSALALSERINYEEGFYESVYTQAVITFYLGNPDSALTLAHKVLSYAEKQGDFRGRTISLNFINVIYKSQNKLEKALEYTGKALEVAKEAEEELDMGVAYYGLGVLHDQIGNTLYAQKYLTQALDIFELLEEEDFMANCHQALASVSQGEVAMDHGQKALTYFLKVENNLAISYTYATLANLHAEGGKKAKALDYWKQALSYSEKGDFNQEIANQSANIASMLILEGKSEAAYPYLQKALKRMDSSGAGEVKIEIFRGLIYYHANQRNTQAVQRYTDSLLSVKDDLYSKEKASVLLDMETKYATQEKEAQNANLRYDLTKKESQRQRILFFGVLGFLILFALIGFLRYRFQQKNKQASLALALQESETSKLKEIDEAKSQFFTHVSHEFRTPISLILGPLESFNTGQLNGAFAEFAPSMERNARRLLTLVNQLLDLAKLDNSSMELAFVKGDPNDLIRPIVASFESLAQVKQVDYQVKLSPTAVNAFFDPDKLEKIVVNVIGNAFKYTQEAGHIRIETSKEGGHFLIRVKDNGQGIEEEDLPHIFDRFYKAGEHDTQSQSTGIGLALVKQLVDIMEGEVHVHSNKGEGSTFSIYLPLIPKNLSEAQKDGLAPFVSSENVELKRINQLNSLPQKAIFNLLGDERILLAEDNPDLRRYISQCFVDHHLVQKENGLAAFEYAVQEIPDLIITDLLMPVMNGLELCQKIKNDPRTSHIPVIMLTAKADVQDRITGIQYGADAYLTKPFNAGELKAIAKQLIEARKKLRIKFRENGFHIDLEEVSSVDEQFLRQITQIVEENMENEEFSIEAFSSLAHMSRSQLHKKIKALTDVSPSVFLRTLRLQRAKALLEKRAGNASEVAYDVGFSNAAYFSRIFKAEFGINPSEVGKS